MAFDRGTLDPESEAYLAAVESARRRWMYDEIDLAFYAEGERSSGADA